MSAAEAIALVLGHSRASSKRLLEEAEKHGALVTAADRVVLPATLDLQFVSEMRMFTLLSHRFVPSLIL